eukprot:TRINITY_DN7471_c0_g1_i1.p1 TRINITY_DN7471_c0_g1~~TRINITY_DN7471_c0_g1_i1.p1  ORF type:complete len:230 (-),score=15.91 TRINITY_DN7471_c0_g1_i1:20-709(-)
MMFSFLQNKVTASLLFLLLSTAFALGTKSSNRPPQVRGKIIEVVDLYNLRIATKERGIIGAKIDYQLPQYIEQEPGSERLLEFLREVILEKEALVTLDPEVNTARIIIDDTDATGKLQILMRSENMLDDDDDLGTNFFAPVLLLIIIFVFLKFQRRILSRNAISNHNDPRSRGNAPGNSNATHNILQRFNAESPIRHSSIKKLLVYIGVGISLWILMFSYCVIVLWYKK